MRCRFRFPVPVIKAPNEPPLDESVTGAFGGAYLFSFISRALKPNAMLQPREG
jgi:hypothetical protein